MAEAQEPVVAATPYGTYLDLQALRTLKGRPGCFKEKSAVS